MKPYGRSHQNFLSREDREDSEPEQLCRDIDIPPLTDSIKKNLKRQNYVPITCFMFSKAGSCPDDVFYTPGLFFKEVTVVGRAVAVESTAKNMKLIIDDSTGCAEVNIIFKEYESQPFWCKKIKKDSYYKIAGQAKVFKDKKSILAVNARKVIDFNELTHHFLNIFYTR